MLTNGVVVKVRLVGRPGYHLLASTGTGLIGELDEFGSSVFDSEEEAEIFMDSHAEVDPEWWDTIEEWRCFPLCEA